MYYVLSRKTKASIEHCLAQVVDGTFAESTIKELMVDLRELARKFPRDGGQPKYDKAFAHFLEVCDFVVHANRDRGVIEKNVRAHVEGLADALAKGDSEKWAKVSSVRNVIHGDELVAGMLGMTYLSLSPHDANPDTRGLERAFGRKSDIALCIISILQDSIIELKDGSGHALLHMVSFDGRYRLYYQVLNSKVEQDARARTGGTGRLILGFPVVVTNAEDIDHILPQLSEASPMLDDPVPPPVIETYRALDGVLHVRPLKA